MNCVTLFIKVRAAVMPSSVRPRATGIPQRSRISPKRSATTSVSSVISIPDQKLSCAARPSATDSKRHRFFSLVSIRPLGSPKHHHRRGFRVQRYVLCYVLVTPSRTLGLPGFIAGEGALIHEIIVEPLSVAAFPPACVFPRQTGWRIAFPLQCWLH
jgi:hypothetical protein